MSSNITKICLSCKKEFPKPANVSLKAWNNNYRKNCSFECRVKSQTGKFGPLANKWKAMVTYATIHGWLKRKYGPAQRCENRGCSFLGFGCSGKSNNFQWASKDGRYIRDRDAYHMLCSSCHRRLDSGRSPVVSGKKAILGKCYFYPDGRLATVS